LGNKMKKLILASNSPYRRLLLQRLRLPFGVVSPQLPETRSGGETGQEMARRLAVAKARAVAARYPGAIVIGSDQVAVLDDRLLGKPGSAGKACRQLSQCAGRRVVFYTGLCVVSENSQQDAVESFQVHFRQLSDREIQRYVELEQPLDCAGSFKCEGLGSVLLERLNGDDPTALEGLPLIRLASMLRATGLDPLA
jgi:septum formation protein